MKDKDFINTALVEMTKVYKIRKIIIQKKYIKACHEAAGNYYSRRVEFTKDDEQLRNLIIAHNNLIQIKYRFQNWLFAGVGRNHKDEKVVDEIRKFISYIDECINNRFSNYEADLILLEAKEGLESLIILCELSR